MEIWGFAIGEKIVVVAIGAGAKPSCVAYFVLTSLSLSVSCEADLYSDFDSCFAARDRLRVDN